MVVWDSKGPGDGPRGIGVDYAGSVYVADKYNHRVQVFKPGTPDNAP